MAQWVKASNVYQAQCPCVILEIHTAGENQVSFCPLPVTTVDMPPYTF